MLRPCASAERLSTSWLKMLTGGPSIDSNAMVGPEPDDMPEVNEALDEVVSLQPAAHAANSAAKTPWRATRTNAMCENPLTTHTTPSRRGRSCRQLERRRSHDLGSAKKRRGPVALTGQRDCIDVAAIVRLAAVRGAPVTEEAIRLRIGAKPKVLDAFDFSGFEAGLDEAGQVEHRVVGSLRRNEIARVGRVRGGEALNEFGTDLVIRLADQRTDCGADVAA